MSYKAAVRNEIRPHNKAGIDTGLSHRVEPLAEDLWRKTLVLEESGTGKEEKRGTDEPEMEPCTFENRNIKSTE